LAASKPLRISTRPGDAASLAISPAVLAISNSGATAGNLALSTAGNLALFVADELIAGELKMDVPMSGVPKAGELRGDVPSAITLDPMAGAT
jgi:hypothetical protein